MISKAWYVQCDICGDPAEIACFSAGEARLFAQNQGYRRIKDKDFCPRCLEKDKS